MAGTNYGQNTATGNVGRNFRILANPASARWKVGGVTLDWDYSLTASSTTLDDGTVLVDGDKYFAAGSVLNKITASGKYGLCRTNGAGGLELVTNAVRGDCYILDRSVLMSEVGSNLVGDVFDAGQVYKSRVKMGGANEPTEANLETMLPGITWVE